MEILIQLLGGHDKYMTLLETLAEKDPQSAELVAEVSQKLCQTLDLPEPLYHALRRLQWLSENVDKADRDLLRNNAFKAANSVGIPLPSSFF